MFSAAGEGYVPKSVVSCFEQHEHIFKEMNGDTSMIDVFDYESPLGVLGKIADQIFLKKYMIRLLEKRNETIKEFAESDKWKTILNIDSLNKSSWK